MNLEQSIQAYHEALDSLTTANAWVTAAESDLDRFERDHEQHKGAT